VLRRVNGSTFLPWLLVGPILVGVLAMVVWQLTGVGAFAVVAQIALAIAVTVMVLAFLASRRASGRKPPPAP
jgi:hypothetical protein